MSAAAADTQLGSGGSNKGGDETLSYTKCIFKTNILFTNNFRHE